MQTDANDAIYGGIMSTTLEFDRGLTIALSLVAGIFALRCLLGSLLYVCGMLPGAIGTRCRSVSAQLTPRLARRFAAAALGAMTLAGTAGLGSVHAAVDPATVELPNLDRGRTVPANAAKPATRPANPPASSPGTRIVVRDGDCLWTLAAQRLGSGATDTQIDREWRRWYKLNRTAIGTNPDLVRTGTRLLVPHSSAS